MDTRRRAGVTLPLMSATLARLSDLPRRLAALGLVAWLAGAGCVLGCAASTGASAAHAHAAPSQSHATRHESHSVEPPDSCPAMRGHDCCGGVESGEGEGNDARSSAGVGGRGERTAMHCPLGGRNASDPARKVRVDTTPAASTPATQSPAPAPSYVTRPRVADALVRDRGGTYLRCCVFLI